MKYFVTQKFPSTELHSLIHVAHATTCTYNLACLFYSFQAKGIFLVQWTISHDILSSFLCQMAFRLKTASCVVCMLYTCIYIYMYVLSDCVCPDYNNMLCITFCVVIHIFVFQKFLTLIVCITCSNIIVTD